MKIRHRHQWVSPYHQHRLVDKMDEKWTIRGLARELGVEWGWVYNRIRNGFLSEPDVSRRPPHGKVVYLHRAGNSSSPQTRYNAPISPPCEGATR